MLDMSADTEEERTKWLETISMIVHRVSEAINEHQTRLQAVVQSPQRPAMMGAPRPPVPTGPTPEEIAALVDEA